MIPDGSLSGSLERGVGAGQRGSAGEGWPGSDGGGEARRCPCALRSRVWANPRRTSELHLARLPLLQRYLDRLPGSRAGLQVRLVFP